jgi:Cu2+-exporting ATPase
MPSPPDAPLAAALSEAALAVEGIHCAACTQLIEICVGEVPGVTRVAVSQTTHRARVAWDGSRAALADIVAAIQRAGYRAWPVSAAGLSEMHRRERRGALWRLFVAGFAMMQVMMYAFPAYLAGEGEMAPDIDLLLKLASLVLTLPVLLFSAAPLFKGAWRDLRLRRVGMDLPVSVAVLVTFAYSLWATFVTGGPVYYDSVSMFVFLLLGGRYLEALARARAAAAIEELARLQPARAERLDGYPASREAVDVAAEALRAGDLVLLRTGAACPADGVVIEGESLCDEALLTGESAPVAKRPGAAMLGGAINLSGPQVVRVTAIGADSRLSAIVRLAEAGAAQKPRALEIADRWAGWFLGAILLLAAASGLGWMATDPARAVWIAVAVLIVTCPCALSLAAPLAFSATIGALASRGVLIVRGHALETLARADCFVFDKTGTLTHGRMKVVETLVLDGGDADTLLRTAGALERWATHPAGRALGMAAAPLLRARPLQQVGDCREVTGGGVEGVLEGRRVRVGSPAFAGAPHGQPLPAQADEVIGRGTLAAVADERGWLGLFVLGDAVREQAFDLVRSLRQAGCRTLLLTGDNEPAAARVRAELGIGEMRFGMSPADKQAAVAALQRGGAVVAMVGDGVNDAPVLAQADVSVAMGSGAPLAQMSADLVLMAGRPADLWLARSLAIKTMRIVRQNLLWALAYNGVAVPLAVAGLLNPWLAGLGMTGSSLVVVLNSLRLLRARSRADAGRTVPALLPAGA